MDRLLWLRSGLVRRVGVWHSHKGRVRVFLIFHNGPFGQYQVRRDVRLVIHRLLCGVRAMRESVCGCHPWGLCGRKPKQRRQQRVLLP